VLLLLWTGPLVLGWLLTCCWRRIAIYRVFFPRRCCVRCSSTPSRWVLATIFIGVSAPQRSTRNTIILWIGLWLIVGSVAKVPDSPVWLQRASFSHDLSEVAPDRVPPRHRAD